MRSTNDYDTHFFPISDGGVSVIKRHIELNPNPNEVVSYFFSYFLFNGLHSTELQLHHK